WQGSQSERVAPAYGRPAGHVIRVGREGSTMNHGHQSDFEHLDERFGACVKGSARVEKLAEGCRWAEGPAYFPAGRYVVWSDIPNDRMMKWDETNGVTSVFRQPAGYTNGNTIDRQGRLVSAQHGY